MKQVYAAVFGLGAFFAMNCGSGTEGGGYSESGTTAGNAATAQQPAESTSSAETITTIKISGHSFDPPEVHVKIGATVRWTWLSGSHNVVSGSACVPDGVFSSGEKLQGAGAKFEQTFDKAGSFPYYCDPHCGMGMTGKVIVE